MAEIDRKKYIKTKLISNYNSYEDFSNSIGVATQQVSRYLNGTVTPRKTIIRVIQLEDYIKANNLPVPAPLEF